MTENVFGRSATVQLYVVAGVAMAGVSAVFSLFAEIEERYNLTTTSIGWIAGSAFLSGLVTQLWLSRYADRGYATILLRAGLVCVAVGLLWFGAATEIWQFIAARSLLGAGVGMIIPPARRAIVLTAEGAPGEKLGTFYASYLAGFVFGPPIAGLLAVIGDVRLPFVVFGSITVLTSISILRLRLPEAERTGRPIETADRQVLRRLILDRRIFAALLVVVSFRYSIGVFEPLWATHLDDLGASTTVISFSLASFALPMLIVAKPAGRLSDRYGARLVSLLAALATVPLMATYGYAGVVWVILAMAVPHGLMEAVLSPGSQAAIAEASGDDDAASAQGLAEAGGSAAAAVGAFTAPALFDWLGPGPAWLIAAVVMVALLLLSWLLDGPRRSSQVLSVDEPGSPSEQRDDFTVVVGNDDIGNSAPTPQIPFGGGSDQGLASPAWADPIDIGTSSQGELIGGVAGTGHRRVGEGEDEPAVTDIEPIHHVRPDLHL